MRKLLGLLLLMSFVLKADAIGYKSVVVSLLDGGTSQINLTDGMKTTFDDTNIIFDDGSFRLELEKSKVAKFEFSETMGINQITSNNPFTNFNGGILELSGMPDNSRLAIYTIAGACLENYEFSGDYSINLNDLAIGVYIVTVNNTSYKLVITK